MSFISDLFGNIKGGFASKRLYVLFMAVVTISTYLFAYFDGKKTAKIECVMLSQNENIKFTNKMRDEKHKLDRILEAKIYDINKKRVVVYDEYGSNSLR